MFFCFRWDNGNHQVAFGRNNRAFIVFNFENGGVLEQSFYTGLSLFVLQLTCYFKARYKT